MLQKNVFSGYPKVTVNLLKEIRSARCISHNVRADFFPCGDKVQYVPPGFVTDHLTQGRNLTVISRPFIYNIIYVFISMIFNDILEHMIPVITSIRASLRDDVYLFEAIQQASYRKAQKNLQEVKNKPYFNCESLFIHNYSSLVGVIYRRDNVPRLYCFTAFIGSSGSF